jgi:V/A-type H+-transporting ATPase subunit I
MTKISVTGPKKSLEEVVEELHRLGAMDIDSYSGNLEKGEPWEEAEDLSQMLVDVRSLLSKMPEVEAEIQDYSVEKLQERLEEISLRLEELEGKEEELKAELSDINQRRKFFRRLKGSGLKCSDLAESRALNVWVGKLDTEEFRSRIEKNTFEVFEGVSASAVIYASSDAEEIEKVLSEVSDKSFSVPEMDLGRAEEVEEMCSFYQQKEKELKAELEDVKQQRKELAQKWRGRVESVEKFLTEKVEKAEAPLNFGTTEHAFIAEGWIPSDKFEEVEEGLAEAAEGKIHIQREETEEEPPVMHQNNRFAQPFESLTDLVAVPKYNELDPSTILLLTFPLFFGFMIGDAGYGLTTLAVFYTGYRMFEGAREIFKSLMYASIATIIFGLAFGDAFGYVIFGHHSELAAVTGIHLFEQIPILFHRAEHLGQVFTISAVIGLVHINLGYLLGAYNEYSRHGLKEAFLEKGSWLVLEAGAALWFLVGAEAGLPVMALSVVLLYLGEGVEGVVEIPSLLSNILSYLRIFGVSVAAVALAAVVNGIADIAFATGSLIGIAFGTLILVVGHVFNTFIKIMEGFLQGIRLHYVEMFGKFYEGGGRKYAPFGAQRLE